MFPAKPLKPLCDSAFYLGRTSSVLLSPPFPVCPVMEAVLQRPKGNPMLPLGGCPSPSPLHPSTLPPPPCSLLSGAPSGPAWLPLSPQPRSPAAQQVWGARDQASASSRLTLRLSSRFLFPHLPVGTARYEAFLLASRFLEFLVIPAAHVREAHVREALKTWSPVHKRPRSSCPPGSWCCLFTHSGLCSFLPAFPTLSFQSQACLLSGPPPGRDLAAHRVKVTHRPSSASPSPIAVSMGDAQGGNLSKHRTGPGGLQCTWRRPGGLWGGGVRHGGLWGWRGEAWRAVGVGVEG